MKQHKILLTGGHAGSTGYAVAKQILKNKKDAKIYWIGAKKALEGKKIETFESKYLPKLGVEFIGITTPRLQRKFSIYTLPSLLKTPLSFIEALYHVAKIKPHVVLSFGGSVSLGVVFASWLQRTPIYIHEQTSAAGLANKISSKFAKNILISRQDSKKIYNSKKTILTGNPINPEILNKKPKTKISKTPRIFITGGSRGSVRMNNAISEALPELTQKYKVIHQTGIHDYNKFNRLKYKNYKAFSNLEPTNMAKQLAKSDIVIARAGANTVSELIYLKKPSILVPIPWTRYNEQNKNAKLASKFGNSIILKESNMSKDNFVKYIENIIKNWDKFNFKQTNKIIKRDKLAAQKISEIILSH